VLVVDDEPDVAELLAVQLSEHGAEVETAGSGEEALELLREGRFDALTADVVMPGMSGTELLRNVRVDPQLGRIPAVIVSVMSGEDALRGEWCVGKPVDPEELADVLGAAITAGRTHVLVVGPSPVRSRLEPLLGGLGLDHDWVTGGPAAAQACTRRRFEVALVDAGVRDPEAVMHALDLRGRRLARAVVPFSSGGEDEAGEEELGSEPVPLEEAAAAVLRILGQGVAFSAGGKT